MLLSGELLEQACHRSGLSDPGEPSFLVGLEELVRSLDTEAQLNEVGRAALQDQMVGNLANRLAVVDWTRRHPEIGAAPLRRPVFIVGLPRTGTTLLSYLLAQDPSHRCLLRFEAQDCVPPPLADAAHSDPRIAQAREGGEMLDVLNPGFKAIHYEAPEGPTECVAVFSQEFKSILWETLANVPSYGRWLLEADYTSAYAYHKVVLQLLQSQMPGRWVLKSPAHCLAPEALVATYPDALFLATHRDPVTAVASTVSLIASLSGTFSDADHLAYITRHWTEVLSEMVRRVENFRAADPANDRRFLDLDYYELVADPLGTARAVYRHIEAPWRPQAEAAMAAYVAANPQGRHGRHAYSLGSLGLERSALEKTFGAYRAAHAIPVEELC